MIRTANLADIDPLVDLENRCFETDRLSRRSFRHLLTKGHAITLLDEEDGAIAGYVMVLLHHGTSLARLYSIAVAPDSRGKGVGARLVAAAEDTAKAQDCVYMRLEIRIDNRSSIGLFQRLGYREFGRYTDYYEDHTDALRLEKFLAIDLAPSLAVVPYYQQTLDFTCGPASLMMAMNALDETIKPDRSLELRLWRESTTVFMTSGHGGCSPYGLALSAHHRGFPVEIFIKEHETMFIDSVRSAEKKEVMRLVEKDFLDEIHQRAIVIHYRRPTVADLVEKFDAGATPIILISSYRIYREKFPHWIVVTGYDERFIYVHDPYVDFEKGKTPTDCMNMPILRQDFERMARYGKSGQHAAVIVYPRNNAKTTRK